MHPDRKSVSSEIKKGLLMKYSIIEEGLWSIFLCFCDKLGINASFQLKHPDTVKKAGITGQSTHSLIHLHIFYLICFHLSLFFSQTLHPHCKPRCINTLMELFAKIHLFRLQEKNIFFFLVASQHLR